jgi:hypothetical protein
MTSVFLRLWAVGFWLCTVAAVSAQSDVVLSNRHAEPESDWNAGTGLFSPQGKRSNDLLTLPLPFFDSFLYPGPRIDSTRWFDFSLVHLIRTGAINPPDYGVMVLDGTNGLRQAYTQATVSGRCDSVTSHAFDLSGYRPSDSIYLSFRYQAGGLLEPPEIPDSLFLSFALVPPPPDSTGFQPPAQFRQVWSSSGGLPTDQWFVAMIPLKDSVFFHDQFQFRFANNGLRAGAYDHWLIDYVSLAAGRSAEDTLPNDQAIVQVTGSVFENYTALTAKQEAALQPSLRAPVAQLANHNGGAADRTLTLTLEDALFGQQLDAQTAQTVSFAAAEASAQFAPWTNPSLGRAAILQQVCALTPVAADPVPENDRFAAPTPLTWYLGYDDGEAEAGFGLTSPRGFGQRFVLGADDSLRAVWLSFFPVFSNAENRGFELGIWSAPHRDSILLRSFSGTNIRFEGAANQFSRYRLNFNPLDEQDSLVPLPREFYVGIIQNNADPIGLGYDENYDGDQLIYRDSSGFWIPTQQRGALMIRLELTSGDSANPLLTSRPDAPQHTTKPAFRLFPNPSAGPVYLQPIEPGHRLAWIEWYDAQGRMIAKNTLADRVDERIELPLPPGLCAGLLTIRLGSVGPNGRLQLHSFRYMYRP